MVGQPSDNISTESGRPHQCIYHTLNTTSSSNLDIPPKSNTETRRKDKLNTVEQHKIRALGEFIELDSNFFVSRGSWSDLFHRVKGQSNFSARLNQLKHKAKPFLLRYTQKGGPVLLHTKPWSLEQKDLAMTRGNHPSTQAFAEFIQSEMTDMRRKGMFIVLPYDSISHLPALWLSPLECVPQQERRPRIINNYTFWCEFLNCQDGPT